MRDAAGRPLKRVFSIIHDDDAGTPIESPIESLRRHPGKSHPENRAALLNTRSGRVAIEYSAVPLRDSRGRFTGAVIVFRDISSRRAVERALQTSEEPGGERKGVVRGEGARSVTLNSIGDAVISSNFRGDVTYLNVVAEKMTGWTQAEARGRALDDVFQLIEVTAREKIHSPSTRAIIEDQTVGLATDCMLIRRDGVELAVEVSASRSTIARAASSVR